MRTAPYDLKASKQTVSVTVNSDLYAKAKGLGINVSQVAEQAVADAYSRKRSEALAAEIEADLAAAAEYAELHGAFGDFVRAHYGRDDGAV
jgi:post-segregation antitoxin (ccd killing protein)